MDSGEDKPDTQPVYALTVDYDQYRIEQRNWLRNVFKSEAYSKAKHRIIITHIPWFHSDDWHGTQHNKECFHDIVQQNHVDAVISGHTHKFGFYPPDNEHNYTIIIGGGPKKDTRAFVEISANKNELNIELKREDGSIVNSLKKK